MHTPDTAAASQTWIVNDDGSVREGVLQDALDVIGWWRSRGESVVFTNGCFDLLHAGHLKSLREAAGQGDHLIVAVNSDSSVRGLKGADRPLQPQAARCELLSEFRCVDVVVCFDGPDPGWLVELIRPDVMVKGSDYRGRRVAGSEFAGRLHFVELLDGCSTTSLATKSSSKSATQGDS